MMVSCRRLSAKIDGNETLVLETERHPKGRQKTAEDLAGNSRHYRRNHADAGEVSD